MIETETRKRIEQLNPWLLYPEKAHQYISPFIPDVYVNRSIEKSISSPRRAVLIVGCRQSGKSTVIWHRIQDAVPNILFLNMEDPLIRSNLTAAADLMELIRTGYSFVKAVFIDEIQHMQEAGLFIKGLVDSRMDIPFWVSGSSSFDLRSKTRESLAGRAIRKRLLPFSSAELISHAAPSNPIESQRIFGEVVNHQLIYGSYPEVYLTPAVEEKIMLLSDLVEALILRDASDLFKIKRIDAFRKLLTLLAGQIGDLINFSELASICNADVGTISSYVEILEESHVVKKVIPFAEGKRREITQAPKVYFIDNGIRNQLLNAFSRDMNLRVDKGRLLENWVFSEIEKMLGIQDALKFWRSKSGAEVDFVIEHGGNIFPLEVKSGFMKKPVVSRSARSFIAAYRPAEFTLLNMSLETTVTIDGTVVKFIRPQGIHPWLERVFNDSAFSPA